MSAIGRKVQRGHISSTTYATVRSAAAWPVGRASWDAGRRGAGGAETSEQAGERTAGEELQHNIEPDRDKKTYALLLSSTC